MTPSRTTSLLGVSAILAVDRLVLSGNRSRPIAGLFDESAHLGTGLFLLAAWHRPAPGFAKGLIAGSVLLDIDHVPELVGAPWLRQKRMRPVPHSVGTLLAMCGLARSERFRGDVLAGATVGVAGHLVRDLATGANSVPLLWPLSRHPFSIRYGLYAAALAALAGAAAAQSRTPPSSSLAA